MAQSVYENAETFFFQGFLTFHPDEGVKWTVREPGARSGARVMQIEFQVPRSMFTTPSLSVTVKVDPLGAASPKIDVAAAREALQAVLGVKVNMEVEDRSNADG
jgi:hypothetical protein